MAETRRLTELAEVALDRMELPGVPVTVALSGGADSSALAFLVRRAGIEMSCLHVDHGLLGSPLMARAAGEVAGALGSPIQTTTVIVPGGASPEGQARVARYAAFDDVTGPLLTAHTRDDNAETVLINLVRGSGPDGLGGIPRFRPPHVYRPMLDVSRAETREMATLAGLPFVDDPMNSDQTLTRNRIRRSILPLLTALNPNVVESLARAGELLGRDAAHLQGQVPSTSGNSVAAGLVQTLPRPLADRLLMNLLRVCGVGVTADRLDRVWSVVLGESPRQDLAGGRIVMRRGALVVVE